MEEPIENQESSPKKRVAWKTPIAMLAVIIVFIAIVVGAIFIFLGEDSGINVGDQSVETQEEPPEGTEGYSNPRTLEGYSLIPGMSFSIQNEGLLLAILDNWGAYENTEIINVIIVSENLEGADVPEESSVSLFPEDRPASFRTDVEDYHDYFVLLTEEELNSNDIRNIVMTKFLELVYDTNVDQDAEISRQQFLTTTLSELSEDRYFIVE